jgi:hypothetical protein
MKPRWMDPCEVRNVAHLFVPWASKTLATRIERASCGVSYLESELNPHDGRKRCRRCLAALKRDGGNER